MQELETRLVVVAALLTLLDDGRFTSDLRERDALAIDVASRIR